MVQHALTKKRPGLKQKWVALSVIILVEVVFGTLLWNRSRPLATKGFIIKNGRQYIVLWKDTNETQGVKVTGSLGDALLYAKTELNMVVGPNGLALHPLEHLWMKSGVGEFTVYWKTMDLKYLNRLTFTKEEEAKHYEAFFKQGAYSPSPMGHSISLIPVKKN